MGLFDSLRRSLGPKQKLEHESHHLVVRGYGVEAVPLLPFSVIHLEDGTLAFGAFPDGPARPNVLLAPGRDPRQIGLYLIDEADGLYALGSTEPDTTALILEPGEKDAKGVLAAFRTVPTRNDVWYVRTEIYELPILQGFTLRADDDVSETGEEPFDFAAEPSALVSILGPFTGRAKVPHAEHFAPKNRDYADQGTLPHQPEAIKWFEYGFKQDGFARRTRYYELIADPLKYTVYFMRAQAPRDGSEKFFEATDKMARGFLPTVR